MPLEQNGSAWAMSSKSSTIHCGRFVLVLTVRLLILYGSLGAGERSEALGRATLTQGNNMAVRRADGRTMTRAGRKVGEALGRAALAQGLSGPVRAALNSLASSFSLPPSGLLPRSWR